MNKELTKDKWNRLTTEEREKWVGKYFNKEYTKLNWEQIDKDTQNHLIILLY